jgi:DNA-binding NtrC family response regulator
LITQFPSASNLNSPILIGRSPAIDLLRAEIAAAARTHAKVLLLGETGVGKEVVARLIHAQSPRATKPCVAVNCSGIPETLLESELFGHIRGSFTDAHRDKIGLIRQAERGTLFLDELGEMSLRMQAVLLRFTETGEIQPVGAEAMARRADVRLITATNRDLRARIAAGEFREDLYYRLNVIQIIIPPLRDRGNDILLLLDHYLAHAAAAHRLPQPQVTPDAAQLLLAYAWPGNVRELRNVTERLVLQDRSRPVMPDDLPSDIRDSAVPTTVGLVRDYTKASEEANATTVERLWGRMAAGEDFWVVVHQAFKRRELARPDVAALIDRGLRETHGSYRALLTLFNLSQTDYKRFHAFLYQQNCNLPIKAYRSGGASFRRDSGTAFSAAPGEASPIGVGA